MPVQSSRSAWLDYRLSVTMLQQGLFIIGILGKYCQLDNTLNARKFR